MTIVPINGRNERMGRLFQKPKHLLLKDGIPAIRQTVNKMAEYGPYIIICGGHYDEGLKDFNRVVVSPTKNVIETLQQGIKGNFSQPLYIVDCDVIPIRLNPPKGNTVYLFENTEKLKHYSNFDVVGEIIVESNEKGEVKRYAGAGVYFFESIATFFKYSNYCTSVAEVVVKMQKNGEIIYGDATSEIFRFGTLEDITGLKRAI